MPGVIGGGAKKKLTVRGFSNQLTAPRAVALATAGWIAFAWAGAAGASTSNPFDVNVPPAAPGDLVPPTPFVDQAGHHLTLRDFHGGALVIGFIYTHCRDACPLISAKFRALETLLPATTFHLVEISVDPQRDSPQALAAYAKRYGAKPARWSLVTGRQSDLELFWRRMGVSVIARSDDVLHNNRLAIVSPEGRITDFIDGDEWAAADVAAQARDAAGLPSSALARWNLALGKAVAYCGGLLAGRGGLGGLVAVLMIFGVFGYALIWVGRKIFTAPA